MLVRIWRKGKTFALLVGIQTGAATVENSMEITQKIKNGYAFDTAISLLGIHPMEPKTLIWKDISTPMFIAVLIFTIAKTWKEPKCLSVSRWVDKMIMGHLHNGIKKKKIDHKKEKNLSFVPVWINQECIMLSEISQSEKDKHHVISLTYGI